MMDIITSNPFDGLDKRIKLDFLSTYNLQLNDIHYSEYGIVDEYYLLSLIGESKIFDVYLGYREGLFYAVKIMKRSVFECKEVLKERIRSFKYELEIRFLLREYECFPLIYHVNHEKYVIVEEYLSNGSLNFYSKSTMSGSLVRYITNELALVMRSLLEKNLVHTYFSLDNVFISKSFKLKVIGFRQISYKIFHDHYQKDKFEPQIDVDLNTSNLLTMISQLIFKEDSAMMNQFNQELFINFNEMENTIDNLISKKKLYLHFDSLNSIKLLYKSLKLNNSILPLYSFDWMSFGEFTSKTEYLDEVGSIRVSALNEYYNRLYLLEKKKLTKKRGLFKVLK